MCAHQRFITSKHSPGCSSFIATPSLSPTVRPPDQSWCTSTTRTRCAILSHGLSPHPRERSRAPQIKALDAHKIVAAAGPQADCVAFVEYIQKNIALYGFRTGLELSTAAAASYTRTQLAEALRKNPYQVNLLIAGWDEGAGPSIHFMDYLASSDKLNFAAHGYAGYFLLSTMDRYWKPGMSEQAGLDLVRKCIAELRTRFLLNQPHFTVKVVTKDGIKLVDLGAE